MSERREARELALQCLYQWDQQGPDAGRELALPHLRSRTKIPAVVEYAHGLLEAFWENSVTVDEKITDVAENWSVHRMAVIDRNILRLATTELLFIPSVPPRVSVDEAIELAKKYSTEKSGAFVNGILDRILKETDREQEGSHGTR